MKKILIILLSVMCLGLWAQDEAVSALTPATDPDANDLLYFVEDGSSTSITKELLQESVTDSLFLTRSGTNLSPKTPGDDFLFRTSSELLKWGDGDTYVQEVVDDILYFYIGGDFRWTLSTSNFNLYVPITPSPDKAIDFGGVGDFFRDAYMNRWYVANTNTYIDTSGTDMRLTDASGSYLLSALAAGGGGDVTKVGTPGDNQVAVWTGDGTIEGTSGLTYDGTSLDIVSTANQYAYIRPSGSSITFYSRKNSTNGMTRLTYNNSASNSILDQMYRGGGTATSIAAAPTDAIIHKVEYNVYDDVPASRSAGSFTFEVDGVIGTDDFDTKYTWSLKEGASANALMLTLGVNGLEYNADHSTDQATNNRWIPDKEYVDGAVVGGDTVTMGEIAPIHSDTVPVFVFGYGTGRATDTLDCWDGAEIGAWLTGPTDSTSFVKFSGVVTAGEGTPTVTVQFFYDANLNDGTPTAITAATAFTSTTSGTEITSFSNQTVPPDMWIWGEITTVSEGNKPVKLRITAHKYTRNGE